MLLHALFGTKHLILVAVSFIFIIAGAILTRRLSLKKSIDILFIIAICAELIKVFYFIITNEDKLGGYLPKTDLPFHLCSMQIIFICILKFSHNESIKRKLESFMLPSCLFGGILAILIATDSSRNGMWMITLEYFGYHSVLSIFAFKLLLDKNINWNIKDYFNCLAILAIFGLLSFYINSILNDGSGKINFMYTVNPPQEGLPYLNKDNGWLSYILRYAFLAVTLISLIYIKPIINHFRKKENIETNIVQEQNE